MAPAPCHRDRRNARWADARAGRDRRSIRLRRYRRCRWEGLDCEFRIANFELNSSLCVPGWDFKFAIRNPQFEIQILVEAPGIEPGSKSQRRRTLHAYLLLFSPGLLAERILPNIE